MIAYFDTSALVKLLITEPGSDTAEQVWHTADLRVCCAIGYTEGAAAIARAWRSAGIDEPTAHGVLVDLATLWSGIAAIRADQELATTAASIAVLFGLRGYDAVHLAAALETRATLVAADGALLDAAHRAGLDAIPVDR